MVLDPASLAASAEGSPLKAQLLRQRTGSWCTQRSAITVTDGRAPERAVPSARVAPEPATDLDPALRLAGNIECMSRRPTGLTRALQLTDGSDHNALPA